MPKKYPLDRFSPKFTMALCASYVDSHPTGGSDKLTNGHRFDTVAIANGQSNSGIPCESSSTMWTST